MYMYMYMYMYMESLKRTTYWPTCSLAYSALTDVPRRYGMRKRRTRGKPPRRICTQPSPPHPPPPPPPRPPTPTPTPQAPLPPSPKVRRAVAARRAGREAAFHSRHRSSGLCMCARRRRRRSVSFVWGSYARSSRFVSCGGVEPRPQTPSPHPHPHHHHHSRPHTLTITLTLTLTLTLVPAPSPTPSPRQAPGVCLRVRPRSTPRWPRQQGDQRHRRCRRCSARGRERRR